VAASGESVVDELPDVFVAEVFQPYGADRGDEVVIDVVAVAQDGVGLQVLGLRVQPGGEVLGDGLGVVEMDAGAFALEDSAEHLGASVLVG
jgi:hypothetical protein